MVKVVYGSPATGFRDVTGPISYEMALHYLRQHTDKIAPQDDSDGPDDPHYFVGLDIMSVESGRLMSWSI